MNYRDFVKSYPDFPKKDVLFWDFSYLLKDVAARDAAIQDMKTFLAGKKINKIAAVESKGFTLGAILAHELQVPLVLIRKPHLIPGNFHHATFIKEYGTGEYELKDDAIASDDRVAIVYDIMAGSGASKAAIDLVRQGKGLPVALVYVTELAYLGGRKDLAGCDIFSLVKVHKKDGHGKS
ncbi:MAG TPA: adenine phosphoribosyltransferase [Patescibacteria group bacterium]|nr:adenine phosphoribosyltransferase [Patescibacteria group bacterium]